MATPTTVADLMTAKVITFFEEQSLPLAEELMKLKKMRHIPVIDDDRHVVGVVTHRDILRVQTQAVNLPNEGKPVTLSPKVPVTKVMSKDVWTVNQSATAASAAKLLLDHAFGCLPVVDDHHKLVGIVTDRDFLKFALGILDSQAS